MGVPARLSLAAWAVAVRGAAASLPRVQAARQVVEVGKRQLHWPQNDWLNKWLQEVAWEVRVAAGLGCLPTGGPSAAA